MKSTFAEKVDRQEQLSAPTPFKWWDFERTISGLEAFWKKYPVNPNPNPSDHEQILWETSAWHIPKEIERLRQAIADPASDHEALACRALTLGDRIAKVRQVLNIDSVMRAHRQQGGRVAAPRRRERNQPFRAEVHTQATDYEKQHPDASRSAKARFVYSKLPPALQQRHTVSAVYELLRGPRPKKSHR